MSSNLATESARGPAVSCSEAHRLAAVWMRELVQRADEIFGSLGGHLAQLNGDEKASALTRTSTVSNLQNVLSMMRHSIPAGRAVAPVTSLEHARHMAAIGVSVDEMQRFYRLGHAHFWELWSADLVETVDDPDRLATALRETAAFTFAYIDAVSRRVTDELLTEREQRRDRATAVRGDLIGAVLRGEPVATDRAELVLGYAISRPQVAFLCWTQEDPAPLRDAAEALAEALGSRRPLLMPDGPQGLAGWAPLMVDRADLDRLPSICAPAAPTIHIALGAVGTGLGGFRRSRDEAERARRVAQLAGRPAPSFTCWEDVALVDLLSRDLDGARRLVDSELGELRAGDERSVALRSALLAYLEAQGSHSAAAAALGVHRNTVLQRLRRAEEARGLPVTQRSRELHAALLLAETLGDAVLATP